MSQVWDDIQALFAEAADLPPAERAALLDARCAGRPDLRAEVDSLLASHALADRFLSGSALDAASEPRVESLAGRIVGRFRLREKIGEGGMGVVYRAERADGEFREEVAVKLIPASLRQPDAVRRFRVERQILATLNHPDIVMLLDGGVTDSGEAYL